ncbi:FAD-dependent oxidoreductase [Paracoccus sp. (in: a-proteobacteria)]|uniref:FAD-dependent oxidoreductase n=1 Tax=Paracoccus sp. TaxID=267 RepID=UPI00272AD225|nr:bifunctional TVP38/TMEM64 family protein/FAD-dependent oxidoreductase [Paracoccus sp. (in: a-proteobacteria)]
MTHKTRTTMAILLVLVAALALGWWLWPLISQPERIRALVASAEAVRDERPVTILALYFLAYVAVAALSLPVAVWLTLGAGALFGLAAGIVLVSLAATLGAVLAFLTARHLLRDRVRARLGARLGERADAIEAGLQRDGAFYLFSLRILPALPFFAVNLLMGLTPIRVWTYAWVSLLGMLPATAIYVNAGTQLAQIERPSDVLSPGIIGSFVALALFPWIARWGLGLWRRRQLGRSADRPRSFDRNVIVIGAGSAGLVAANVAASAGARVTLVEAHRMGGDCLNTGCVPSKALIASAKAAHAARNAARMGIAAGPVTVDFPAVMARIRAAIAAIAPHDSAERYRGLGVEVIQGRARLADPWTVDIALPDGLTRRLTARAIILATGAAPVMPDLPGLAEAGALTSETLWDRLAQRGSLPARLVVLGGGPIGLELAQAMARLGSAVTVVEAAPRLLPQEGERTASLIAGALAADGVTVLTGTRALAAGTEGAARWLEIEAGGTTRRLPCDEILVAVGRKPRIEGLGLDGLGVPISGSIETNEHLQTTWPHILAAGDVAGPWQFTHAAGHQGAQAALNALFGDLWRQKGKLAAMPRVTFTDPQIARMGLGPHEAAKRGLAHDVTRYPLASLDRAVAEGATEGLVEVVTAKGRDRVLGVTIVAPEAGEMLAPFALAMQNGLGLSRMLSTVLPYPTWSEANRNLAGQWRRARLNPRLMAMLARYHEWRRA